MEDFKDFVKEFLLPVGSAIATIIVVILFFVSTVGEIHGRWQCSNYAEITGKGTKYVTLDVCYVETEEGWMRYPEYLKRFQAYDGLKGVLK